MKKEVVGYWLGSYFIDLQHRQVTLEGRPIPISERNFLLLCTLSKASPNLVSKEELLAILWSDRVVSDWALARIVSDTRVILGDNGEQQELIKTARGQGFSIPTVTPVFDDDQNLPVKANISKRKLSYRTFIASLTVVIFLFIGYRMNQQRLLVQAVENIAYHQTITFTNFKAQIARRNELAQMIEERHGIKRSREFEKFFAFHFNEMNKEEMFVFEQIRAMTMTGLYPSNQAILDELDQHPELLALIPLTKELQQHLQFWVNKYHSVFLKHDEMCLLYVGVEDGLPYPSQVDKNVRAWLGSQTTPEPTSNE